MTKFPSSSNVNAPFAAAPERAVDEIFSPVVSLYTTKSPSVENDILTRPSTLVRFCPLSKEWVIHIKPTPDVSEDKILESIAAEEL